MRILIADQFEEAGREALKAAGCEVVYEPEIHGEALEDAIRDTIAAVLVVRSTKVTAAMLEAGALSLVVRAGAGYNNIDVSNASRRGIYVATCPGKNAIAVAELAFGLLISLDRRIPDAVADLRCGRWNKRDYSKARGLYGRTLGILGYGAIGQEMAKRAHAFGMPVVVWSRRFLHGQHPEDEHVPIAIARTPREVAERSDVLSVHVALADETANLVNVSVIEALKPGLYFINTARSEVVDYAALEKAVRERGLHVALDVYASEPTASFGEFKDPLALLPGVYGTHHVGASTDQAQEAISAETVRIITTYKDTGKVQNVVNLSKKTPATHVLVVRTRDRPGVLAHVFDALRSANINVQETENVIFDGAYAAVARINVDRAPTEALLKTIYKGNDDILDLHVVTI